MFLDLDLKNGDAIAAVDDTGNEISYGELTQFTRDFYRSIGKRTLIFILSENYIGSLAAYVASMSNKVVPLIISCDMDFEAIQKLIIEYKPEYLWVPERLEAKFSYVKVFKSFNFVLLKTELSPFDLHKDLSLLLSTSGSTGSPKLVRHTYTNVSENAKNIAAFFELSPKDNAMAILPMHYTMGLSVVTSHLYSGATVLLSNANLTDRKFWTYIKDRNATSFTGVPFSFELLDKLRFFRMDLPDLELLTQGGGKLSKELFIKFADFAKKTSKRFIATYGQTEGTARMAYLPYDKALEKSGSIGKAIPGGKLYLIDQNGLEINEISTEGQLVYTGPNVTMGYALNGNDLVKGDINRGVLKTGDIAIQDEDGYFYIVGRTSRFLKLYGVRISLDELQEMVSVKFKTDCVCAGNDQKMKVYITNEDINKAVSDYIIEQTKLFHKAFEVIAIDNIPRNSVGKIIYSI